MREIVKRLESRGGREDREFARDWLPGDGAEGARRSVSVPKRRRANVDVIATIETCVAAVVGTVAGGEFGGYRVPMIVPKFVMNASPGPCYICQMCAERLERQNLPDTKKNPMASHHIVLSFRNRLVSPFNSHAFFLASSSSCALASSTLLASRISSSEVLSKEP